jgi:hypothetical protein
VVIGITDDETRITVGNPYLEATWQMPVSEAEMTDEPLTMWASATEEWWCR